MGRNLRALVAVAFVGLLLTGGAFLSRLSEPRGVCGAAFTQVRAGMTRAEIEAGLGQPRLRSISGRTRDMWVDYHEGVVLIVTFDEIRPEAFRAECVAIDVCTTPLAPDSVLAALRPPTWKEKMNSWVAAAGSYLGL